MIIVLALIVIAIPSFFIYDYTQNNPRFCTTCHLMNDAYDTWTVSAMHDLNCHSCHEGSMVENLGHVTKVLLSDPEVVTKETIIDNEKCESCHTSEDPQWLQVADTAGHKVHIFSNENIAECIDCHGINLHVFMPPEEACTQCHDDNRINVETIMGTHCVSCHNFLVEGDEPLPNRNDCIVCHVEEDSMGASFPYNAHNDTACMNCHNPHQDEPFPDCASCHEATGTLHTTHSTNDCTSCHLPHSEVEIRNNCLSCHLDKSDHFAPTSCVSCHG